MTIDWTINITTLIAIVTFLGGGVVFLVSVRSDINTLKTGFKQIEDRLGEMAEAITAIARAEEKIVALNNRIDDEKREGVEFRAWLRDEIARIWKTVNNTHRS